MISLSRRSITWTVDSIRWLTGSVEKASLRSRGPLSGPRTASKMYYVGLGIGVGVVVDEDSLEYSQS